MKVTCQSCQAKYTIADEKVRGKVAKIRCKKCGTTIVVDGTDGASPTSKAPTSSRGVEASSANGESLSPPTAASMSPTEDLAEPAPRSPAAPAPEGVRAPEPVALRRPGRGASTDLFGAASRHEDGMTSALAPMPHASSEATSEKLTGARNENSVLFSLSALTSGQGNTPAPADVAPSSRSADLRSLISTTKTPGAKDGSKLDDIMNLGGGGLYSPALIAPALAPPPLEFSATTDDSAGRPKGKGRLAAILGVVVIVAGAAVAYTTLNGTKEAPNAAASAPVASIAAAPPPEPASVAPSEVAPTPTAANSAPEPAAKIAAAATPAAETPPPAPTVLAPGQTVPKPAEPAWKPPPPKTEAPKAVAAAAPPVEKTEKPAAPAPAAPAPAAPAAGGSGEFDRAAALSALSATASAAQACKKSDGPTGSGRVAVTYASNGAATTAVIEGPPFAGTAVGGCVAARFRATRVPPFGGSAITVHKTFNIN